MLQLNRLSSFPQMRRGLSEGWKFFRSLASKFHRDHCSHVASTLTVTSLLALVPVIALTLSVLAMFPAFQRFGGQIQEFIFNNFVPPFGATVQEYLLRLVEQASRLRIVGTLLFIGTALLLVAAIDKALNDIWQVKRQRPLIRTLLVYWAVITLGPLLLAVSLGFTSYFFSISGVTELAWFQRFLYTMMPWAFTAAALTVLYVAMPNRRVSLAHGVTGGIVAAALLEVAKRGFATYVSWVPTYEFVFGALAAVPLFVLWINLSWFIFLLGAEMTYVLGVYPSYSGVGLQDKFTASYRLLGHFWKEHQQGDSLDTRQLLSLEPGLAEGSLVEVLNGLVKAGLITLTATDRYQLARDLRSVTLAQFYRTLPWRLPRQYDLSATGKESVAETQHTGYANVLQKAWQTLDGVLDIPLETLYRESNNRIMSS